jgi:hypothetical protein
VYISASLITTKLINYHGDIKFSAHDSFLEKPSPTLKIFESQIILKFWEQVI